MGPILIPYLFNIDIFQKYQYLTSYWRTVHDLKLAQCFILCDGILIRSDGLFSNDAQLHHLDLYPHQVKANFSQDAIFEMKGLFCELKLDMKALFNANFHLDRIVLLGLDSQVLNDEFFFLRDSIIVSIDHYIDKVSKPNDNPVVRLKLFLDAIK